MSLVWRDGSVLSGDVSPGAFPAGARLFETVAIRGGKVERLGDHLARLRLGLAHLGLPAGPLAAGDLGAWRRAVGALGARDAILRLVAGPGLEELGARPLLGSPPSFRLRTLRTRRDDPEWSPRPKAAPWANSLAATRELRELGEPAGTEGVQLDARGFVSEASRSSLAWIADGALRVPAESTGRLPGTALAQLMAVAGLPVVATEAPPPSRAEAILVLRSTLPGGAAPAHAWADEAGAPLWSGDPSAAGGILRRLADFRAQDAVSLA